MTSGFYVIGRHTSVAWCKTRSEAERIARQLNYRGGTHYTVEPGDKLTFAEVLARQPRRPDLTRVG